MRRGELGLRWTSGRLDGRGDGESAVFAETGTKASGVGSRVVVVGGRVVAIHDREAEIAYPEDALTAEPYGGDQI